MVSEGDMDCAQRMQSMQLPDIISYLIKQTERRPGVLHRLPVAP